MLRLILLSLVACGGSEYGSKPYPKQEDSEAFKKVAPLIAEHCGGCHGQGKQQQGFPNESRWKGSQAKTRIENGSMPPNKRLEQNVKDSMLASFAN